MVAPEAETHLRVKIDPNGKTKHPNIEPLCSSERRRLLGQSSVGYMTDEVEYVNCLACKLIMENNKERK